MGGKDYESMEVVPFKDERPRLQWVIHGDRRLGYFDDDVDAQTTDPLLFQKNIRMRLSYLVFNVSRTSLAMASHLDPRDEVVVSPDFLRAALPKLKYRKKVEAIRLKCARRTISCPLKIKKKKEIFCGRIRHLIKKKNKTRSLEKYCERIEKKRISREQKLEKRKAIEMAKAARQVAAKRQQIKQSTPVAKLDQYCWVTLGSVPCLKYSAYVNDEILDFGIALALKRNRDVPDTFYVDVHGWTSFFYKDSALQIDSSERYLKKLRKRVQNLLALKYLIVPVVRENHWLMVIVCQPFPEEASVLALERKAGGGQNMRPYSNLLYHTWITGNRRPKVLVFDSLVHRPRQNCMDEELEAFHKDTIHRVKNGIFNLHKRFWTDTGRAIELSPANEDYLHRMVEHHVMNVPGQKNGYDCGMYVITYVMMWFNELKKVSDDYTAIYCKNFEDAFPYKACGNLRHCLYKKIYDWCSNDPELQKEVAKIEVPPCLSWRSHKKDGGPEEPGPII